ncbi:MAG: ABC transporter permease [Lautropia sp.]
MPTLPRIAATLRRTLLQAVPTVAGIVVLNFLLLQLVPGDAADMIAAESGAATEETMRQIRQHFGLDLPTLQRLYAYGADLLRFDLGVSPRHNTPVLALIGERLGNTLLLMLTALSLALAGGILAGVLMATFVGRWPDRVLSVLALLLYSTPSFWLGLMAIVVFAVQLGWLPSGGHRSIGAGLAGWPLVLDVARHLALPAAAMAGFYVAVFGRLTRAAMLEVNHLDFVRTASAKGLSRWQITVHHVLRNALIPVTTVAGLHLGALLGGSIVIESVFSWPGLGRLALESVQARDFNVLLGILLLSSLLVIVANAIVDLLQAWLDPRVEVR